MEAIISTLWSLQFWFAFALGATFGLALGALLYMARGNTEEDQKPYDPIPGDIPTVDIGDFLRRHK